MAVTKGSPKPQNQLNHRMIAMLRAVAAGRAELGCSCEPDLRVDGLPCCDQAAARQLARAGLVRPSAPCATGQWVRAELTQRGRQALIQFDTEMASTAA